jgi:hypothetical protein
VTIPDIEPVHVVYDADASCPGRTKFVEELMARTPKVSMAEAPSAKRTFVVTVRATESGFVGRLEIRAGDPTSTTRELTGPSCPAVVSAVALVAALAVDPDSLRGDAPDKAAVREPPQPAPAIGNAASVAGKPSFTSSPGPAPRKDRDWRWAVGAKGETNSFIAPKLSFGGGAFVELAPVDDGAGAVPIQGSLGVEALRVGVHYAVTGTVQQSVGSAHFDWAALSLEGCPARVRSASVQLDVCAVFAGGLLRGHGDRVSDPGLEFQPGDPLRPWWSIAPLLRVKWTFFGSWFVDAEGSLMIPLRRDRFVFDQPPERRLLYEVPKLGAGAGLGIGFRFDDRERDRRP